MEKDMTIKIKYSRTDKIVLGIGYTLLGLFVLAIIVPASELPVQEARLRQIWLQ